MSTGLFFPINIADILKYIVTIVDNWEILGMQLNVPHLFWWKSEPIILTTLWPVRSR